MYIYIYIYYGTAPPKEDAFVHVLMVFTVPADFSYDTIMQRCFFCWGGASISMYIYIFIYVLSPMKTVQPPNRPVGQKNDSEIEELQ